MKKIVVSLLLLLLLGCKTSVIKQQSIVVNLSNECEQGDVISCDKLPKEVNKLKELIKNKVDSD